MEQSTKIILPMSKLAKSKGDDYTDHCSWFSITDYDTLDDDDIRPSVDDILKIVVEEVGQLRGRSRRVFLGGFGQGGIVAFSTFLRYNQDVLGGCFVVNGFAMLDFDWKQINIPQK